MSLLRIRAGYFLSGIGFGAGIALLQLRADLAASTELLSTQVEASDKSLSARVTELEQAVARLSTNTSNPSS